MSELVQNIVIAVTGLIIGYISSMILARYNARMALQRELKNAIALKKGDDYLKLWKLCDSNITTVSEMKERKEAMDEWYANGGGLFLTFKATNHFFGAAKLLASNENSNLNAVKKEFTWLRTEMKVEVGSYTRKEADTYLPNVEKN